MSSIREQRCKKLESAYFRLPVWLQIVLLPWLYPAMLFACFPVFTPASCLAGAVFLAYLKVNYLHEQVTWSQVGLMGVAPLIFPVFMCYVAISAAIIGLLPVLGPMYLTLILARWWKGEPLRLLSLDWPRKEKR